MTTGPQVTSNGMRVCIVARIDKHSALLVQHLTTVGYTVQTFSRDEAFMLVGRSAPDLLVLDLAEPGAVALDHLHQLRSAPETKFVPIIILAERVSETDVIAVLGAGADDIVHKPFSVPELLARVEALLRRRSPVKTSNVVTVGDTEFDRDLICS
jgi:two-component system, OmpR family, phosphate regulon response regulator PhoB